MALKAAIHEAIMLFGIIERSEILMSFLSPHIMYIHSSVSIEGLPISAFDVVFRSSRPLVISSATISRDKQDFLTKKKIITFETGSERESCGRFLNDTDKNVVLWDNI